MNITMFQDMDTGFMAATLKPAFQALGHTCTVIQVLTTYLEDSPTHIDYLLKTMTDEQILALKDIYKETDLFIIRSVTDLTLRISGILPFLNKHNTVFKVHGSELRENNVPYSLRTWRINWHNKEPLLLAPREPTLAPLYRSHTLTHIERPCAFDTFPKKKQNKVQPFALTAATNFERKGTQTLIDTWKSKSIPLHAIQGVPRTEVLHTKAQCSFFIDNIISHKQAAFYNMNSVEAWFYKVPVFAHYNPIDEVIVPQLSKLIILSNKDSIQHNIEAYIPDSKALSYAHKYAITTHDPFSIAQQYIHLLSYIH